MTIVTSPVSSPPFRVLIIGGYGGFGARLARRLAKNGLHVVVGGRCLTKAEACAKAIGHDAGAVMIDRSGDIAPILSVIRPNLVIDAAGPFQHSTLAVAHACIAASVHYCDLADARDFVARIATLDAEAQAVGVAVVSGASSVPALSGAVIRSLGDDMTRLCQVEIAISASNSATAGASVAAAIIGAAGQPVQLWAGQRWQRAWGWQRLSRMRFADRSSISSDASFSRWVALTDVPDHDEVPQRMPGAPATRFRAGPELALHSFGLWVLSWPVRWRWITSARMFVRLGQWLHRLTASMGGDRSAMMVEVTGEWAGGGAVRRWTLIARQSDGPEIPTLAAELVAMGIAEQRIGAGARSAGGLLDLADFAPLFDQLAVTTHMAEYRLEPLYVRVMGHRFAALPAPVRAMHSIFGDGAATGTATVTRGHNPLATLVARIMRFPKGGAHDLHVHFTERDGVERWTRAFSGQEFHSQLSAINRKGKMQLVERFGPLRFRFDLPSDEDGLEMIMRGWSACGVPLPLSLAPRAAAHEWAEGAYFCFDVSIALPIIGPIVHYRGRLRRLPLGDIHGQSL